MVGYYTPFSGAWKFTPFFKVDQKALSPHMLLAFGAFMLLTHIAIYIKGETRISVYQTPRPFLFEIIYSILFCPLAKRALSHQT